MNVVLDLDETLIHVSNEHNASRKYDFVFSLGGATYYGLKRPNLDLFLKYIFHACRSVSVWTAGTRDYAIAVLNHIMTPEQRRSLAFFKTREDLVRVESGYHKPLKVMFLDPRSTKFGIMPDNTIMIDDREEVLQSNPGNGLLIPAWRGDPDDRYLPSTVLVLKEMIASEMVVGHFRQVIKLTDIVRTPRASRTPRAPSPKPRTPSVRAPSTPAPRTPRTPKARTPKTPKATRTPSIRAPRLTTPTVTTRTPRTTKTKKS